MAEDIFRIDGQVVVITGGAGVLCSAMVADLCRRGAKLAILDCNADAAQACAVTASTQGGTAIGVCCDALDRGSLEQAHAAVAEAFGPADVLINGAGGNRREATTSPDFSFFDLPAEALRAVFDLNFLSAVLATQVFAADMAAGRRGVIVNIASMNAFRPLTRIPAYSAAKAALVNFTQWLAVHMCQTYSPRIRVNALAPGFFLTEQNRFLLTDPESGSLTARGRSIRDHTPMQRFGSADDLLGALLWLISDAARFVTGVVVPIDGGFNAYSGV